jgi:signal transduction histidine kinase
MHAFEDPAAPAISPPVRAPLGARAVLEAVPAAASCPSRVVIDADPDIVLGLCQWRAVARIAQEAISNALQHADRDHANAKVWVRLRAEDGRLKLSIRDGGQGLPELSDRATPGLDRIRAAAAELGGACRIDNRNYGGAEVSVVFRPS